MKKKIVILTTLLSSTLLLSACAGKPVPMEIPHKEDLVEQVEEEVPKEQTNEEVAEEVQEKSDEEKLKEYVEEQDEKIESLTKEVDYYKNYVKDITLTLSSEKLQAIIDKEWNYSITVNSVQFPKNGILEIGQSDFELVFKEERVPYSVLPEEESLKGKLATQLDHSMSLQIATEKVSSKTEEKERVHTLVHSFKGLTLNDVVKITLSEELATKLGMSTKELEIRITN